MIDNIITNKIYIHNLTYYRRMANFNTMPLLKKYYYDPLYRNSMAIILNMAFTSIFGLLFWVVAAHTMSSTIVGLATATISVGTLITILSKFGLDFGLIRFLPTLDNKDDLYSTTILITFAVSTIAIILFLIGIDVFSPSLRSIRDGWLPIMIIIYIAVTSMSNIQNVALIALRRADLSMAMNLILGLRIPILILIAAWGILGIFSALDITLLIYLIISIFVISRLGVKLKPVIKRRSLNESLGFSLGNYTADIFTIAPSTILPILIVNTIGAENGAYFYVAYSIASLLFIIPSAIATSLFVEGSHNMPLKENIMKSMAFALLLLVPMIIGVFLVGDKLLLLFSSEFSSQSFELLKLLAASSLFSVVTSLYIAIKRVQKDVKMVNYINIVSSVSLICLGYVFILDYGLLGIGYAWLILNVLMSLGLVLVSVKYDNLTTQVLRA